MKIRFIYNVQSITGSNGLQANAGVYVCMRLCCLRIICLTEQYCLIIKRIVMKTKLHILGSEYCWLK